MCKNNTFFEVFKTIEMRTGAENGVVFLSPVYGGRYGILAFPVFGEDAAVEFICSSGNKILYFINTA